MQPVSFQTSEGIEPGEWRIWLQPGSHDFNSGKTVRDTWFLQSPSGKRIALDSLSPPQTLDSLAEEFVRLLGKAAADQAWREFNPTIERLDNGEERILSNSWKRPDYWPAVLRD